MSIIIELKEGIVKRATTAGKENTGSIAFMGGSYYIRNLDANIKDGTHKDIKMDADYSERYGTSPTSIISSTFVK